MILVKPANVESAAFKNLAACVQLPSLTITQKLVEAVNFKLRQHILDLSCALHKPGCKGNVPVFQSKL